MAFDFSGAPPQDEATKTTVRVSSPDVAFMEAMQREGLEPGGLVPNDDIVRFDVNKGDKAGWYVFHANDSIPWGVFGNWSTGLNRHWSAKAESDMSSAELEDFKRRVKEAKAARKAQQAALHAAAKERAALEWSQANPASPDHPYLSSKGVASHGLRVAHDGRLMVPVEDMFGDLHSIQFIPPDGKKKRFLPDGAISGNFFTIPGNEKVFICEGYATGATVHAATGGTVVVAFNTSNLKPVAKEIKTKFPSNQITFCADNDQWTKCADGRPNPGVVYATEAAAEINARVLIPEFENPEPKKTTDFNDLARVGGIDAVKLQIVGAPRRYELAAWDMSAYAGPAPERRWLVRHTFPMAAVSILAAMGDAGKGMLTMKLALEVAADRKKGFDFSGSTDTFGNPVIEEGTAVIFTAEDDRDEVHRRLESVDPDGRRFGALAKKRLVIIPMPNAGGPVPFFVPGRHGPELSPVFHEVKDMLMEVEDLKLVVFDPLASFVAADINADPAVGSFTTGKLSALATETGASIIVPHHMGKGNADKVKTPEQARALVRGSTAIVDGVRAVFVLWPKEFNRARQDCVSLGVDFQRNRVFCGALVKSNGPGDRETKTFVRNEFGLLTVRDNDIENAALSPEGLLKMLYQDIRDAAFVGQPFTKSGESGVFERREELSNQLKKVGRDPLQQMVQQLLESGDVVKCMVPGSKLKKWLDVPGGLFAEGGGTFEIGKRKEKSECLP